MSKRIPTTPKTKVLSNGVELLWDFAKDTYVQRPENELLAFVADAIVYSDKIVSSAKIAKMLVNASARPKYLRDRYSSIDPATGGRVHRKFSLLDMPNPRKGTVTAKIIREQVVTRELCERYNLPIHGATKGYVGIVDHLPDGYTGEMMDYEGADRSLEGRMMALSSRRRSARNARAINVGKDMTVLAAKLDENGDFKATAMAERAERLENERELEAIEPYGGKAA